MSDQSSLPFETPVTRTSAPTTREWKQADNPPYHWVHETGGGLLVLLEACTECGSPGGVRCEPDFSYRIDNPELGGFGIWYAFHPARVKAGDLT